MDSSYDVPDPSDWLNTSIPQLAPVETALRCQVCKDFYDTPMITSCSHTFCSLCIRRCLTSDGKCPACRAPDQELRLRRNWTVQEIVDTFKVARPAALRLGQNAFATSGASAQASAQAIGKRKLSDTYLEGEEGERPARRTRSQRSKGSDSQRLESNHANNNERGDDDQPEDGLTACPICNRRMKMEDVFTHLDIHNEPNHAFADVPKTARRSPSVEIPSRSRHNARPMERLPQLNYSLMNDNALRKKLVGLGIPNGGPRTLMEKRHMEWVNLVNANCDSNRPRTKRELLKDLEVWDRSQGRQVSNGTSGPNDHNAIMGKDFDGVAWATSHNDDFQRLISQARPKRMHQDKSNVKTSAALDHSHNLDNPHPDQPPSFDTNDSSVSKKCYGRSDQPLSDDSLVSDFPLPNESRSNGIGIRQSAGTGFDLDFND